MEVAGDMEVTGNVVYVTFSYHTHGLEESHNLWQSFVLNFVQRQTLHECFQSQCLLPLPLLLVVVLLYATSYAAQQC
nr:hypothetical protein CFP56_53514 [Quercus suber]